MVTLFYHILIIAAQYVVCLLFFFLELSIYYIGIKFNFTPPQKKIAAYILLNTALFYDGNRKDFQITFQIFI